MSFRTLAGSAKNQSSLGIAGPSSCSSLASMRAAWILQGTHSAAAGASAFSPVGFDHDSMVPVFAVRAVPAFWVGLSSSAITDGAAFPVKLWLTVHGEGFII